MFRTFRNCLFILVAAPAFAACAASASSASATGGGTVNDIHQTHALANGIPAVRSLLLYPGSEAEVAIDDACFRVSNPSSDTLVFVPLFADSLEDRLQDNKAEKLVVRQCASN
jgi:hypothetical protein